MITDINSEDRLVQQTFANHLRDRLGWQSVYAYNAETFGPQGTLGRASTRDVVLVARPADSARTPEPRTFRNRHANRPSRKSSVSTLLGRSFSTIGSATAFFVAGCRSSGGTRAAKPGTHMRR